MIKQIISTIHQEHILAIQCDMSLIQVNRDRPIKCLLNHETNHVSHYINQRVMIQTLESIYEFLPPNFDQLSFNLMIVLSSWAVTWKEPSPSNSTTRPLRAAGSVDVCCASAAPRAAGSMWPIENQRPETITRQDWSGRTKSRPPRMGVALARRIMS